LNFLGVTKATHEGRKTIMFQIVAQTVTFHAGAGAKNEIEIRGITTGNEEREWKGHSVSQKEKKNLTFK